MPEEAARVGNGCITAKAGNNDRPKEVTAAVDDGQSIELAETGNECRSC